MAVIAASTKHLGFKFDLFIIAYEYYLVHRQKFSSVCFSAEKSKVPVGDIAGIFLDSEFSRWEKDKSIRRTGKMFDNKSV